MYQERSASKLAVKVSAERKSWGSTSSTPMVAASATAATYVANAGTIRIARRRRNPDREMPPVRSISRYSNRVITKPEMTKKILTPRLPMSPQMFIQLSAGAYLVPLTCASSTSAIESARRPSSEGIRDADPLRTGMFDLELFLQLVHA